MQRCSGFLALKCISSLSSGRSWVILFRFFTSLFPFRCFACRLVHSVFHPWIAAVQLPCLALFIVFVKVGSRVWPDLIDAVDRIDTRASRIQVTKRYAALLWMFSFATHALSGLCVLYGYFVPVFHQFVSFSVFRLSFSSFCFPSVDCGCMASLPGLGLLFLCESGFSGLA